MPRRTAPIPPFSRLERAALQALAWELAPAIPQIEGLADEATPGRYFQATSSFVRHTGMAGTRSGPAHGRSGVFGSVHAVIEGLADPVGFQIQLRKGRLVALIGDAYGQDLSGIDLLNSRFDQLFYLDAHDRSLPIDPALYRRRDRSQPRSEPAVAPTHPPQARPAVPATPISRPSPAPVARAPVSAEDAIASGIDKTTLKIGIWAGLIAFAVVIGLITRGSFVIPLIVAFWLARALTQPKALDRIHRSLASRRAGQIG